MPTRVKICGVTRPEDATAAVEHGADAIGLNLFAGPRKITLERAHDIISYLPPLVTPIGLTSGPCSEHPQAPTISEALLGTGITTFQVYGEDVVRDISDPVIRAAVKYWAVLHIAPGNMTAQINLFQASLRTAEAIVIDALVKGSLGGTGQTIDWTELMKALRADLFRNWDPPIILAGGLTPDNVAEAIRIAQPYAVDVSSGVEVAGKPGIKDPIKMRDFIQAVRGV